MQFNRLLDLKLPRKQSAFLWGPRKCGKSYWIKQSLAPDEMELVDLLKTEVFAEYAARPSLLRERFSQTKKRVVIDEVQKVPLLLDEVHGLIENYGVAFLLTGSSARKLKRAKANMLGGRAWRRVMTPLTYQETKANDLERIFTSGLLPPHFLSQNPREDLRAYVADYLKEEIAAEANEQQLPAFSQFLRVAALTSSGLINYANLGRESGVKTHVARRYVDLLEDTLLGFRIAPWTKSKNRRLIETEKFYLFDVGLTNFLCQRQPKAGTPEFGWAFEHFVLMEIRAYQAYRNPELDICFWRTSTGQEVDFILGPKLLALEIKSSERVNDADLRHMLTLAEDGPLRKKVVVCRERQPRKVGDIEILPWTVFFERLWAGDFGLD